MLFFLLLDNLNKFIKSGSRGSTQKEMMDTVCCSFEGVQLFFCCFCHFIFSLVLVGVRVWFRGAPLAPVFCLTEAEKCSE